MRRKREEAESATPVTIHGIGLGKIEAQQKLSEAIIIYSTINS